ncbi:MAG: ammonium transporter, partial [Candidatus Nitrosotenuis sp.]
MKTRNHKYALLLMVAVTATSAGALSQAFAQQVSDGMDGYVKGTSGIYTGNTHECWYDDGTGKMLPCKIDSGDTA